MSRALSCSCPLDVRPEVDLVCSFFETERVFKLAILLVFIGCIGRSNIVHQTAAVGIGVPWYRSVLVLGQRSKYVFRFVGHEKRGVLQSRHI